MLTARGDAPAARRNSTRTVRLPWWLGASGQCCWRQVCELLTKSIVVADVAWMSGIVGWPRVGWIVAEQREECQHAHAHLRGGTCQGGACAGAHCGHGGGAQEEAGGEEEQQGTSESSMQGCLTAAPATAAAVAAGCALHRAD